MYFLSEILWRALKSYQINEKCFKKINVGVLVMPKALTTGSKATDLRPCIAMLGIRSLLWALSKRKGSLAWWLSLRIFPLGFVSAEETRGDIVHESPECHCISMVWPWSCLLTPWEGHEEKTMPPPGVLEAHGRLLSVLDESSRGSRGWGLGTMEQRKGLCGLGRISDVKGNTEYLLLLRCGS